MQPRVLLISLVLVAAFTACGSEQASEQASQQATERSEEPSIHTSRFFQTYVDADGRVVRHDQGGDTVSEGQSYAMLLAVRAGDREVFDRVWSWTKSNLQVDSSLFAWRWADGAIADPSPAADADIDIASALVAAAERFDEPQLLDEARRVAGAVLEHEALHDGERIVIVAGPWAVADRIVNPSYLARCEYGALARATGDQRWEQVDRTSIALLDELVRVGLPPDWAQLDAGTDGALRSIAGPDDRGRPGRYGFDAARIGAHLAQCDEGKNVAGALWDRLQERGDPGLLEDGQEHPVGLIGAGGAALAAGDREVAQNLFDRAVRFDETHPTYYGAAWVAFGALQSL